MRGRLFSVFGIRGVDMDFLLILSSFSEPMSHRTSPSYLTSFCIFWMTYSDAREKVGQ